MSYLEILRLAYPTEAQAAGRLGSMQSILKDVSSAYQIPFNAILGKSQCYSYKTPKLKAVLLMRLAGFKTTQISHKMKIHHTTVVFYMREIGITKSQLKGK